jgi:hypothetical protein
MAIFSAGFCVENTLPSAMALVRFEFSNRSSALLHQIDPQRETFSTFFNICPSCTIPRTSISIRPESNLNCFLLIALTVLWLDVWYVLQDISIY